MQDMSDAQRDRLKAEEAHRRADLDRGLKELSLKAKLAVQDCLNALLQAAEVRGTDGSKGRSIAP